MRAAAIVPAYQAEPTIGAVIERLLELWPDPRAVFLVDDGCTDATARIALRAGATVLHHERNRGKGAALHTGLTAARGRGFDVVVTLDADGQHPPEEALALLHDCPDPEAIVLGVRDLVGAGAPRANQLSNRFSNWVLSGFAGRRFDDTQCGLRRYPVATTLGLGVRDLGYGFEAEVLLRAAAAGVRVVHQPIRVIYPPESERISHFDAVRDPTKIVLRVVQTVAVTRAAQLLGRPVAGA